MMTAGPPPPSTRFASLYVHTPFCETKCHYCDFYSLGSEKTRPEDPGRFEAALRSECSRWADRLSDSLDTIFLGGGTPSMTPPESLARSLEPLRLSARLTLETEWTMEANPSSITSENMRAYRQFGVNRVSMGVQAMQDDLLKLLGRVHSRKHALRALEEVFEAGFTNVSVDLLCGVPGQSLENIREALETLSSFPITHLSCYLLTLARQHPLAGRLPDEDAQLEHLLFVDRWMRERGFEHYEISNYARPGHRARHNMKCWTGRSYLGLGPSAHSYDALLLKRWKNVSSLHRYAALLKDGQSPTEAFEDLTPRQHQLEQWMLTLRLQDGFPENWLDNAARRERARALSTQGLLEPHPCRPGYQRLTARGFALSDHVIAVLSQ